MTPRRLDGPRPWMLLLGAVVVLAGWTGWVVWGFPGALFRASIAAFPVLLAWAVWDRARDRKEEVAR